MELNDHQKLVAAPQSENLPSAASRACPFTSQGLNESQIAQQRYGENCRWHGLLGYYQSCFVGHVQEADFRDKGSSGGLVTWILAELLKKNLVDAVVHVGDQIPSKQDSRIAGYRISRDVNALRQNAKSRYHPVEFSEVLKELKNTNERIAFVGVPCFIKAVRLLCEESPQLEAQVKFTVALVCGHLKSLAFAQMFSWQMGIAPKQLQRFDFRVKLPQYPANRYGVTGESVTKTETRPTHQLFGGNWGHGLFKYKACDYCDDVFGETADIAIGDGWLPGFKDDYRGTNVAVVRNPEIHELVLQGINSQRLELKEISPDIVADSQTSGIRHRREGLFYRATAKDKAGQWRPQKRVLFSKIQFRRKRSKMFLARERLVEASHQAFREAIERDDYSHFERTMTPLIAKYESLQKPHLVYRIVSALLRRVGIRLNDNKVKYNDPSFHIEQPTTSDTPS